MRYFWERSYHFGLEHPVIEVILGFLTFVEVCGYTSELNEFMFFKLLCQGNIVKIVECINGRFETVVVFFGDQQTVECLVDRFVIQVLHRPQVGFHKFQVVHLRHKKIIIRFDLLHRSNLLKPFKY